MQNFQFSGSTVDVLAAACGGQMDYVENWFDNLQLEAALSFTGLPTQALHSAAVQRRHLSLDTSYYKLSAVNREAPLFGADNRAAYQKDLD